MTNSTTVNQSQQPETNVQAGEAEKFLEELIALRERMLAGKITEIDLGWVSPPVIVGLMELHYRTMELVGRLFRDQRRLEDEHDSLVEALHNAEVFPLITAEEFADESIEPSVE